MEGTKGGTEEGGDTLNGGGLVKEAEMPVHGQMKATLV